MGALSFTKHTPSHWNLKSPGEAIYFRRNKRKAAPLKIRGIAEQPKKNRRRKDCGEIETGASHYFSSRNAEYNSRLFFPQHSSDILLTQSAVRHRRNPLRLRSRPSSFLRKPRGKTQEEADGSFRPPTVERSTVGLRVRNAEF